MKMPLTIRIKNRSYLIKVLPAAISKKNGFLGDCDFEKKVIRVATHLGQEEASSTLLHEILHGLLHEYGIEVKDEEVMVCALEDALFQVLRDNRGALRYILGE